MSIPVYVSELSAVDQCLNYLTVGCVDAIILHVNGTADFRVDRFEALVERMEPLRGRVLVNPERIAIPRMRSDPHHIAFLHRAHVANFRHAQKRLDFDIFCLDASNSLLVLPGLCDYVVPERTGALGPHRWLGFYWHARSLGDPIWALLGDDWWQVNPEGTFYRRSSFAAIAERVALYEVLLARQAAEGRSPLCEFPREEYLFPSLNAQLHGTGDLVPPYIWLRWSTSLAWGASELRGVLDAGQILDWHRPVYGAVGIKRIGYGIDDWARVMVGERYGYRATTLEAARMWAAG